MTQIQHSASKKIIAWDKEADVVIVGYGCAGAVCGITCHDAGTETIILEKMKPGFEGGNTRASAGIVFSPEDVEAAKAYIRALSLGELDEDMIETMAASMSENADYLISLGARPERKRNRGLGTFPHLPGSNQCATSYYTHGNGQGLFSLLAKHITNRRIDVLYEMPGNQLIQGNGGEILGVVAGQPKHPMNIKAKRAVVLTCGGFLFDSRMQKDFLSAWPISGFGSPANTGDGIRMAQKAGADLWHMSSVLGPLAPAFKVPDADIHASISMPNDGFIFVDKYGRRFMNEKKDPFFGRNWPELAVYDPTHTEFPRIPWTIIFDEATRKEGPLVPSVRKINSGELSIDIKTTWAVVVEQIKWSADNAKEIELGWVAQGNTISDLGRFLGIDSNNLESTILRYNNFCGTAKDEAFGRPPDTLLPIDTPPYYAIRVYPGGISTQGGPRRNSKGQVMDPFGKPIPRLYAAGELGSVWGFLYQASGNLADCVAFGRIAGQNAVSEKPWD
jgi:succinate dehydrogenase/fumarate reductase flavoprotein subunit